MGVDFILLHYCERVGGENMEDHIFHCAVSR